MAVSAGFAGLAARRSSDAMQRAIDVDKDPTVMSGPPDSILGSPGSPGSPGGSPHIRTSIRPNNGSERTGLSSFRPSRIGSTLSRSMRSEAATSKSEMDRHINEICNIYRYSGNAKPNQLLGGDHLGNLIFNPQGQRRIIWDLCILSLVVFYVFVVPCRVVWDLATTGSAATLDNVADCLFIADIVLNFRTAYTKDGSLVTDPKMIAREYGKFWFPLDLVASIPLGLFLPEDSNLGKFNKLFRMLRLTKMFRFFRLGRMFENIKNQIKVNPSILRFLKSILSLLLFWHVIGCFYWALVMEIYEGTTDCPHIPGFQCFVNECVYFGDCIKMLDGTIVRCKWWFMEHGEQLPSLATVSSEEYCKGVSSMQIPDIWLPHPYYANQGFWPQYWQAIFWAVEATTGVGCDIAPIRADEILLTTAVGMCGLLISALIIGSAGSALYNMDNAGAENRANLEGISAYLTKRKVPMFFQKIIADYYDHKWSLPIGENNKILQELPHTLRVRLELVLKAELVQRVDFLVHLSPIHATHLIRVLTAVVFLPGEYIARLGKESLYPRALYIVHSGRIDEIDIMEDRTVGRRPTGHHQGKGRPSMLKLRRGDTVKHLLTSRFEMSSRRRTDISPAFKERELIRRTYKAGEVFGEETLLGVHWEQRYRAVEFCDVLRLSEIDFKALCETHPDFHSEYEEMVEVVKAEKRLEQMDDRY